MFIRFIVSELNANLISENMPMIGICNIAVRLHSEHSCIFPPNRWAFGLDDIWKLWCDIEFFVI